MLRNSRLFPLVLALGLAWSPALFARAGGGEDYDDPPSDSSSSSSSDWSSGSGSSSGSASTWDSSDDTSRRSRGPANPRVAYALIGLFVLVLVLLIIAQRRNHADTRPLPLPPPPVSPNLTDGLAALRAADPAFDPVAFRQRARAIFEATQDAWFRRQLEPVVAHLSDGVVQRFELLLEFMRADGIRDAIADLRVLEATLVAAERRDAFDSITVAFRASLRDTEVSSRLSDDAARDAARRTNAEEFLEFWTFVRRPDRKSARGETPACPNCGAPWSGVKRGRCTHCEAIINSGAYDWVVCEITQRTELPTTPDVPGLASLRDKDPATALQILEDRASVVFWQWLKAVRTRNTAKARRYCTPAAFSALDAYLADKLPTVRHPAVGSVELREVVLDRDGFDEATVHVNWRAETDLGGPDVARRKLTHALVLRRRTDAKTDAGVGLSTERCGKCRAPVTDSGSSACTHCGADLTKAEHDWQLGAISAVA